MKYVLAKNDLQKWVYQRLEGQARDGLKSQSPASSLVHSACKGLVSRLRHKNIRDSDSLEARTASWKMENDNEGRGPSSR